MFTAKNSRPRTAASSTAAAAAIVLIGTGLGVLGSATSASAATPTCFGRPATIVGTAASQTIRGTAGDDVIWAGGGNDIVFGGGGNDLICGDEGHDELHGGPGNDWLDGGRGRVWTDSTGTGVRGDYLYGDAGDDFFSPVWDGRYAPIEPDVIKFSNSPAAVTVNANTHTITGEGTDTWLGNRAQIEGSNFNDTFIGGPLADDFNGGGGADLLIGNGGDDTLRDATPGKANSAADRMDGGAGNDQLFTQGGADTLIGGVGNDKLWDYGRSAGTMIGGDGNDDIMDGIAVTAAQSIDAGAGADTVTVYSNIATVRGPRLTIDLLPGMASFSGGAQWVFRGAESLNVYGVPLTWRGTNGDDKVYSDGTAKLIADGRAGNDTMVGGPSNDEFIGGPGTDTVRKNGGSDVCNTVESFLDGSCKAF